MLHHLRVEQFNHYFSPVFGSGAGDVATAATGEDTREADETNPLAIITHRHYDARAETIAVSTRLNGTIQEATRMSRRKNSELAVSRTPVLEPLGEQREHFYEQRLLLGLPWHCTGYPLRHTGAASPCATAACKSLPSATWTLEALLDEFDLGEARLPKIDIILGPDQIMSFEEKCQQLEEECCKAEHGLVCRCCALEIDGSPCLSCRFAVGFHKCQLHGERFWWCKGSLHAGECDVSRMLYLLHKKNLPIGALKTKTQEYVDAGHLSVEEAKQVIRTVEKERGVEREVNANASCDLDGDDAGRLASETVSGNLSMAALREMLTVRENQMKTGRKSDDGAQVVGETDQWRVYNKIVSAIENKDRLRLMIQASAGTGKTFFLTTIALWCKVHGETCCSEKIIAKSAAPTGIAASNIELHGTDIIASTFHHMLGMDSEMQCKLDFTDVNNTKIQNLLAMRVFLFDEVSMVDSDCWWQLESVFEKLQKAHGATGANVRDNFGDVHVLLFGDFKQLPPATGQPFIVLNSVHEQFDFEELVENRRVTEDPNRTGELENFHAVLSDISRGEASQRAEEFVIQLYVAGAGMKASTVEFEGHTAVFAKRRYKDDQGGWNSIITRRLAKRSNHSIRITGQCRAKGTRGQWYQKARAKAIRKRTRSAAPWNLHFAGEWNGESVWRDPLAAPHLMRVMLVSNLDVENKKANGSQGRLLHWCPASGDGRKALEAGFPNLHVRFVDESAYRARAEFKHVTDWIDVPARENTLTGQDCKTVLHQVPVSPAYALTIHKVQSLSIKHDVLGCLEGIFAYGQLYVLMSRVTDPRLLKLIGLPPFDLLDKVAEAWKQNKLDVNKCFRDACAITREWEYINAPLGEETVDVRKRLKPRMQPWQTIPARLREFAEVLKPQPAATLVFKRLLDWIHRVAVASRLGTTRPDFATEDGEPIFPDAEELWWLTDVQKRAATDKAKRTGDEDGPADVSSAEEHALDVKTGEEAGEETTDAEDDDSGGEELTWYSRAETAAKSCIEIAPVQLGRARSAIRERGEAAPADAEDGCRSAPQHETTSNTSNNPGHCFPTATLSSFMIACDHLEPGQPPPEATSSKPARDAAARAKQPPENVTASLAAALELPTDTPAARLRRSLAIAAAQRLQ